MIRLSDYLPLNLLLTLKSAPAFPDASLRLEEIEKSLHIYLHALMRSCEHKLVSSRKKQPLRRHLFSQRHMNNLVWEESGNAHLPETIQRFANKQLNRDLYYWLAAYIAFDQPLPAPQKNTPPLSTALGHLLQGVMTSHRVLKACPGLAERFQRLSSACLVERRSAVPAANLQRNAAAAMIEAGFRRALGDMHVDLPRWLEHAIDAAKVGILLPDPPAELMNNKLPFWPVAMWGRPQQAEAVHPSLTEELIEEEFFERKQDETSSGPESFELEEYQEPPGEEKLDTMSGAFFYPEWDCKRNSYRHNWCQITEEEQDDDGWEEPPLVLKKLSRRVRRQFEALRTDDRWIHRLNDGEEIDLDDFIEAVTERRGCGYASDKLYKHRKHDDRELAVSVLLDISNSTLVQFGHGRVIDIERQAMIVLAEALSELGDIFSIYAFSGYGRTQVDIQRLKTFEEDYTDRIRRRIYSLKPRGSTRIGAALRHMGMRMLNRPERHRLLLILTDGRPFDPADNYKGVYALEDTRKALQELHNEGIYAYGLTIDRAGLEYLPYLFGPGKYTVFSNIQALPEFLPKLYARLTGLSH